ncbi:DUF4136 domain-containing protein [Simiduia agarivorans]|uniref:Uncharacterized protein n=1 Tax=Simiduia agarivorans (strain DSM 21679 / JCM 13881 / BCRC 17597 / SA1) TaxID=1117647 RepID=K4KZP4_SIMAS|nr:DUF4136 domain-containing protein [Simiduia agarivorans]AFU99407.1 hypothetical protein M5M_11150 [Simiduia agarivorans SA1 = DSM 21679]
MQKYLLAGLATLLLSACASQQAPQPDAQAKEKADLAAFSVVSVTDPEFKPNRGDTISWTADVVFVGEEETAEDSQGVELIQADIEKNLTRKGYTLGHGVDVDYRIIAVVQVGDEKLSEEMRELFRLYPSLGRDSQLHKGMLIVAVARPGSVQALWRGAIKVFLDEDHLLSDEQRRARLDLAVQKVMSSMPKAL